MRGTIAAMNLESPTLAVGKQAPDLKKSDMVVDSVSLLADDRNLTRNNLRTPKVHAKAQAYLRAASAGASSTAASSASGLLSEVCAKKVRFVVAGSESGESVGSWNLLSPGELAGGDISEDMDAIMQGSALLPGSIRWETKMGDPENTYKDVHFMTNMPGLEDIAISNYLYKRGARNLLPEEVHSVSKATRMVLDRGGEGGEEAFGRIFPAMLELFAQNKRTWELNALWEVKADQLTSKRGIGYQKDIPEAQTHKEMAAQPGPWECSVCGVTLTLTHREWTEGSQVPCPGKCKMRSVTPKPSGKAAGLTIRSKAGEFSLRIGDGGWFLKKQGEEEAVDVSSENMRKYAVDTSTCASKPYLTQDTKYMCLKSELGGVSWPDQSVSEMMGEIGDMRGVNCLTPLPGFRKKIWRGDRCPDEVPEEEPDLSQQQMSVNPMVQVMQEAFQELNMPIQEEATGWDPKYTQDELQDEEPGPELTMKLQSMEVGPKPEQGAEHLSEDPSAASGAEQGKSEGGEADCPGGEPQKKERKPRKPLLESLMGKEEWDAYAAMLAGAQAGAMKAQEEGKAIPSGGSFLVQSMRDQMKHYEEHLKEDPVSMARIQAIVDKETQRSTQGPSESPEYVKEWQTLKPTVVSRGSEFWPTGLRSKIEAGKFNCQGLCDLDGASVKQAIYEYSVVMRQLPESAHNFPYLFNEMPEMVSGADGKPIQVDNQSLGSKVACMQFMLRGYKGEVRLVAGAWQVDSSPVSQPDWLQKDVLDGWLAPSGKPRLVELEKRTWPRDEMPPADAQRVMSAAGLWSSQELEEQRARNERPRLEDCVGPLVAHFRESAQGVIDPDRCWRRQVSAITLPELMMWDGCKLTGRELFDMWESFLVIAPSMNRPNRRKGQDRRAGTAEDRWTRKEDHEFLRSQAVDFFKAKGIEVKTPEDMRKAWQELGNILVQTSFAIRNFDQIMAMPVASHHDDIDHMWWRCQFDERLTVPVEGLPVEIRELFQGDKVCWAEIYYRCTTTLWWREDDSVLRMASEAAGSSSAASGAEQGPPGVAGVQKQDGDVPVGVNQRQMEHSEYRRPPNMDAGQGTYHCPCKKEKGKHWRSAPCGLILSATSQWSHTQRVGKNRSKNVWSCAYCKGQWSGKEGKGARFIQLYTRGMVIQIILDSCPDSLWNKWCKDRIEYYKRMEPIEAVRDVSPIIPEGSRYVFKAVGPHSDSIWTNILTDPSLELRKQVSLMSQRFVAKQTRMTAMERMEEMPSEVVDLTA